jgi:DNA-binding SARP family transcriptional activator
VGEPEICVGVLGPVVVRSATDQSLLSLPAAPRGMLAALALCAPPVRSDRLLSLLWQDDPPASGRTAVHVVVSRLREFLRTQAGGKVWVEHHRGGYRLEIAANGVTDADRFLRLVAESGSVEDLQQRFDLLDAALGLWRGPVAADVPDTLRHCEPARQLESARVRAAEQLAELAPRCGRSPDAAARLSDLLPSYPFHERLHAKYALLVAAQGQQAEALDVINRLTRRLGDELGLDAGADLRQAHEQILYQLIGDHEAPRRARGIGIWRGPRGYLDRIIGRDRDQVALLELLATHRVVTVTGAGGCGKTTLALRVAEDLAPRYPDGVLVLALAGLRSTEELVAAFGTLLRVRTSDPDPLDGIERAVVGKRILLVVDNCEHLAESCAVVVRRLLGAGTELTVLTTSRQPLGVSGEAIWTLEPLELSEAHPSHVA